MKLFISLFCLCIFSCEQSEQHTRRESPSDPETQCQTIVVALEQHVEWGHYQFIRGNRHIGLELDLLQDIEAHSSYHFDYVVLPWKRAMKETHDGSIDILISATASRERDATYDYTDEIYQINQVLYYDRERHPNGFQFQRQSEIAAYRTGAILGYNIDALEFPITHAGYTQLNVMARAIEMDRIDFAIAYLELEKFNQHMPADFGHVMIPGHPPLSCRWLISKKNPRREAILRELNNGLKQLKQSGRYEELENAYLLTK